MKRLLRNTAFAAISFLFISFVSWAQPTVTFTPANAAINFTETNNLTIGFSESVRRASDNANLTDTNVDGLITLKLTDAAGVDIPFDATINAGDDLITINPTASLPSGALIYVAITNVENSSNTSISPATQSVTFTVRDYEFVAPVFSPANAAANVSLTNNLTITFAEAIRKLDNSALVDADLVSPLLELKVGSDAGSAVPFSATIDAAKQIITINPTSDLLNNTTYYLELGGVEDGGDNAINPNPTSITFSTPDTNPSTLTFTPLTAATNVNEDNDITIGFNETVRRASDDANLTDAMIGAIVTLKLTNAAGADIPFTGTINAGDDLITINPDASLPSGATIYVAITNVEDLNGNAITPATQSITFTVRDHDLAPPVFSPANGATNVSVTNNLTITFAEAIRKLDNSPLVDGDLVSPILELKIGNDAGASVPFTATIDAGKQVITINPTSDLINNTLYYLEIGGVEDGSDNAIDPNPTSITFSTPDSNPPTLTFTPLNGATGVNESNDITIAFNESVRRASDDADLMDAMISGLITLKLTDATGANIPFAGTINAGDNLITINPSSSLPSSAIIYVAITNVEDLSGNAISPATQSITFTVRDYQGPLPTFSPLNGATNVPITSNLTITFDEAIRKIDNSALNNGDLVSPLLELKVGNDGGAAVPFTATIDATKQIITIDPTSDLLNNTTYYLEIGGVEDGNNNAISPNPTSITFTTPDTNPATLTFTPLNAATGVNENNNITIAFSEPVRKADDNANLTDALIGGLVTLKLNNAAGADIPFVGTINAGDDLITINPSSALPSSTVIYVAITNVEDLSGNIIDPNPQSITFTVRDYQPPVITFNPPNGTAGFGLSNNVVITFDEPIRKADGSPLVDADIASLILFKQDNIGGANVPFTGTINAAKTQITLDPTANLLVNKTYYVRLNPIEDVLGNESSQVTISFVTVNLTVEAGANRAICAGQSTTLGGSPTVVPSSGFYSITWSSDVGGFTSNSTNPVVNPTETTVYTVTVEDTDGNTMDDDVTISVNQPADPADIQIILTPFSPNYNRDTDGSVALSYDLLNGVTGTGVFSGAVVNSTTSQFITSGADIGSNLVTLTFTSSNGCVTTVNRTIQVYSPDAFLSPLQSKYCANTLSTNLSIEELPNENFLDIATLERKDEFGDYVPVPLGSGWTLNVVTDQITINPSELGVGAYKFKIKYNYLKTCYSFYYVYNPACFCLEPVFYSYPCTDVYDAEPTFEVVPLPELTLKTSTDNCINNGNPAVTLFPSSGTLLINGGTPGLTLSGGQYFIEVTNPALQTSTETPNYNVLSYSYTDGNLCTNTTSLNVNIFDVPTLNFDNNSICEGASKSFTTSTLSNIPSGVAVDYYTWTYGDGNSHPLPKDGEQNDPSFVYTHDFPRGPATYNVTLSMRTEDGCNVAITKPVIVAPVPEVVFTWENVCNKQETRFTGITSLNDSEITDIIWDFGDGDSFTLGPNKNDPVSLPNTSGTRIAPRHKFILPAGDSLRANSFDVTFEIISTFTCRRDTTITIYKVPNISVTNTDNYFNDFDGTITQWISGGDNSSWEWGAPASAKINSDASGTGKAWKTDLDGKYKANEKSWVHSPCFDLTALERPVLSFDRRLLTETKDGVVLQVNTTNSTNANSNWDVVGAINDGLLWYNKLLIEGSPGGQNAVGWEGATALDSAGWRTSVLALDDYLPSLGTAARKNVRFRIAFGSNNDAPANEGFAFDNFQINQRSRTVLVEQFTNSGSNNTSATEPNKRSNEQVNQFINLPKTTNEIVKIEYHLGLPGPNEDELYNDNPQDANARAAYYGISSTPYTMMDAGSGEGSFFTNPGGWASNQFSRISLQSAKIQFDTILCTVGDHEKLNIRVDFETLQDLPANTIFHVVAVERSIDDVTGANGESVFTYVMKKMIPSAAGTRYNQELADGFTGSFTVEWTPEAYDLDNLSFVVFAQNESTREIYQAGFLEEPQEMSDPSLITGDEDDVYSKRVSLFPNPANRQVTISLPAAVTKPTAVTLIDAFGRTVYESVFKTGERSKTISTADFADGMYMVQFLSPQGKKILRKMMVKHQ